MYQYKTQQILIVTKAAIEHITEDIKIYRINLITTNHPSNVISGKQLS